MLFLTRRTSVEGDGGQWEGAPLARRSMTTSRYTVLSLSSVDVILIFAQQTVWPDLAKFCQSGEMFKVFDNFLAFGKILNLLSPFFAVGQIFIVANVLSNVEQIMPFGHTVNRYQLLSCFIYQASKYWKMFCSPVRCSESILKQNLFTIITYS